MSDEIFDPSPEDRARILGEADPAFLTIGPNSLGDPVIREALVRGFYSGVANVRAAYLAEQVSPDEAPNRVDALATGLQAILYGQDPAYTPVISWNNPERLGRWLHDTYRMEDDGPDQAVRALLITMAGELLGCMARYERGEWSQEDIEAKVDGLIEDTLAVIIGIKPGED